MMKYLIIILILSQSLICNLIIDSTDKRIDNFDIYYYYDDSSSKTIDDIINLPFTKKIKNNISLGFKKGDNWFKLKIKNKTKKEEFILYNSESFLQKVDLYEYVQNRWIVHKNGLNTISKKNIKNKYPTFLLKIKENEEKTFYINTHTFFPHFNKFTIYTKKDNLIKDEMFYEKQYMFYYGGLFIIIIFNLFILLALKEIVYGYYIGYTFFYMLFIMSLNGHTLDLNLDSYYYIFHSFSSPLLMGFLFLFTNELLNIKKYNYKLYYFSYFMALSYFILALLLAIDIQKYYSLLTIFSSFTFFILLLISLYIWIKGNSNAKFYFFALSIYLITMFLFTSMVNGWIDNTKLNRYLFLYASFFEIIFFSLMLASRFYSLNKEKVNTLNQLREKEKLLQEQTRLAQMGEMINMIAHQWRQPLGAINSALFVIDAKLKMNKFNLSKEKDKKEFLKLLNNKQKNIYEYVQFLSTTIDDFRNFFKQDKQKQNLPLNSSIKKALHIINSSLKNKNIEIIQNYQINPNISIYQNEMIQVILNILKNSEDSFLEKDIQDRKITITTKKKDLDYLVISICDNAGGIDENILNKIFDPYFSTKLEKNGTGLGLYISKMIVQKHHNGKLNAYNHKDGVCFKIILKQTFEEENKLN